MSAWRNKRSGITSKSQAESKDVSANVDLRKLRRVDLLELLVDQIRENEDNTKQIQELTALSDRLKAKLDEKDEQIERLKEKLNQKDAIIEQLEKQGIVDIRADGTSKVRLEDIFRVAHDAAEQYLRSLVTEE